MNTNRNIKNSVFTHLFSDPAYQLQLYLELNPDCKDVTIHDIQDVTIENVFTTQQINDLGFIVKDEILFLVEAQSTWTENILLRMLFYYFETVKRKIVEKQRNVYSSSKVPVLKPVFYVIYTGNKKVPDRISFQEIYFENNSSLDINAYAHIVHRTDNKNTISAQYILFSKIFDEQRKKYGYKMKAIEETLKICKNEGILKSFIKSKESEVVDAMSYFMDQEKITELTLRDEREKMYKEAYEEAYEEVYEKVYEEAYKEGEKSKFEAFSELVKDGLLSLQEALKRTGLTEEEFYKMYPELR